MEVHHLKNPNNSAHNSTLSKLGHFRTDKVHWKYGPCIFVSILPWDLYSLRIMDSRTSHGYREFPHLHYVRIINSQCFLWILWVLQCGPWLKSTTNVHIYLKLTSSTVWCGLKPSIRQFTNSICLITSAAKAALCLLVRISSFFLSRIEECFIPRYILIWHDYFRYKGMNVGDEIIGICSSRINALSEACDFYKETCVDAMAQTAENAKLLSIWNKHSCMK